MFFDLDKKNFDLILKFEKISFLISLIGTFILYIHLKYFVDFILYKIGISIFRTGLISGICSFCFGVFFNKIQKEKR